MKKKIGIGAIVGILIPIIIMGSIYLVFNLNNKVMNEEVQSSALLFGLGINALTTWLLFRKNKEYIGRGIMLATFIYFIIWVLKFT